MQNQNENQRNLTPNQGTPNQKKSGGGKGCLIAFIAVGGGFAALCILIFLVSMIFSAGSNTSTESNYSVSQSLQSDEITTSESDYFESNYGKSEDEVIQTLTVQAVRENIISQSNPDVFDIEILEKDGHYNYIVSAKTKTSGFDTMWRVLIKLDPESHFITHPQIIMGQLIFTGIE